MRHARRVMARYVTPRRLLIVIAIIVAVQLVYPGNRTLPNQKIGAQPVSVSNPEQLSKQLKAREKTIPVTVESQSRTHRLTWQQLGITIDTDATIKEATNYPLWQRLIPFSALYKSTISDTPLITKPDDAKIQAFAGQVAAKDSRAPTNASLSVKDGKVSIVSDKSGYNYPAESVAQQIANAKLEPGDSLELKYETAQPKYDKNDVRPLAERAETLMSAKLSLVIDNKSHNVDRNDIGSWLRFYEENSELKVGFDKAKVKAYVAAKGKDVYRAPGKTTVVLVDGQETSRSEEKKGRSVNDEQGATKLISTLEDSKKVVSTKVNVALKEVPPEYVYQRNYTRTSRGLNALLADTAAKYPDMAISVTALDGSGISGSAKGAKAYNPASLYKLSVAHETLKRIEAGSLQWSDDVNGRNVQQCFNDMIVSSDNPCGEGLGNKLGWGAVTASARSIGMSGTNLASRSNFVTTTDDQVTFMAKLHQGQLASASNTENLINLMKQQRYRSGVPAGAKGSTVADKPGFIGGLINDSAIVYGPRGAYAISICSNNSNWAAVSGAAASVHELMSR